MEDDEAKKTADEEAPTASSSAAAAAGAAGVAPPRNPTNAPPEEENEDSPNRISQSPVEDQQKEVLAPGPDSKKNNDSTEETAGTTAPPPSAAAAATTTTTVAPEKPLAFSPPRPPVAWKGQPAGDSSSQKSQTPDDSSSSIWQVVQQDYLNQVKSLHGIISERLRNRKGMENISSTQGTKEDETKAPVVSRVPSKFSFKISEKEICTKGEKFDFILLGGEFHTVLKDLVETYIEHFVEEGGPKSPAENPSSSVDVVIYRLVVEHSPTFVAGIDKEGDRTVLKPEEVLKGGPHYQNMFQKVRACFLFLLANSYYHLVAPSAPSVKNEPAVTAGTPNSSIAGTPAAAPAPVGSATANALSTKTEAVNTGATKPVAPAVAAETDTAKTMKIAVKDPPNGAASFAAAAANEPAGPVVRTTSDASTIVAGNATAQKQAPLEPAAPVEEIAQSIPAAAAKAQPKPAQAEDSQTKPAPSLPVEQKKPAPAAVAQPKSAPPTASQLKPAPTPASQPKPPPTTTETAAAKPPSKEIVPQIPGRSVPAVAGRPAPGILLHPKPYSALLEASRAKSAAAKTYSALLEASRKSAPAAASPSQRKPPPEAFLEARRRPGGAPPKTPDRNVKHAAHMEATPIHANTTTGKTKRTAQPAPVGPTFVPTGASGHSKRKRKEEKKSRPSKKAKRKNGPMVTPDQLTYDWSSLNLNGTEAWNRFLKQRMLDDPVKHPTVPQVNALDTYHLTQSLKNQLRTIPPPDDSPLHAALAYMPPPSAKELARQFAQDRRVRFSTAPPPPAPASCPDDLRPMYSRMATVYQEMVAQDATDPANSYLQRSYQFKTAKEMRQHMIEAEQDVGALAIKEERVLRTAKKLGLWGDTNMETNEEEKDEETPAETTEGGEEEDKPVFWQKNFAELLKSGHPSTRYLMSHDNF